MLPEAHAAAKALALTAAGIPVLVMAGEFAYEELRYYYIKRGVVRSLTAYVNCPVLIVSVGDYRITPDVLLRLSQGKLYA